jgi:hypothetical protein
MPLAYIHLLDSSPESAPPRPGQGPVWSGPVEPGWGVRPPVDPGYGLGAGLRPDQGLPIYGYPGHGLPSVPGHPDASPPTAPGHPDAGLPVTPGHPDAGLPPAPGHVWPPVNVPPGTWILVWVIGVGYRWISSGGARPSPPIAATPAPKTP